MNKSERAELRRRRRALMNLMGERSVAIVPAARPAVRSRDTEYPYRQNSNFHYLTGFEEPEAIMVLVPGRRAGQYLVFCRERDAEKEIWHGRRLGVERAPEALGADDAFPIGDVDDIMPGLLEGRRHVYHTLGKDPEFDVRLLGWLQRSRSRHRDGPGDPESIVSIDHHLHEMRLFKSRAEQNLMRRAAEISVAGHLAAMRYCRPGLREYELEAELIRTFRRHDAQHAFLPIVGGGVNGCILHYTDNDAELADGDLVLIDAGAEYEGYAGDVTRTFPVNGRFSDAQREVYEIVLAAQAAAIAAVKPGNHWNDPHDAALRELTIGLRGLGLLKGKLPELLKKEAYKPFYMHRTGHWLGRDVHDVGEYKVDGNWRLFEPGMITTIEPGLYLHGQKRLPARYRGIGIRIEDDVLVTGDGHRVLTDEVPKAVDAIESTMAAA